MTPTVEKPRPTPRRWSSSAVAELLELPPGSVVAVIGIPGTGKSRLVQEADARGAFPRRVVFDPYAWRHVQVLDQGGVAYPWVGELYTPTELLHSSQVLDKDPLELVVAPRKLEPKELGKDFSATAELVWSTSHVDLIAEEAGLYGREAVDLVMRFASGGRHAGARFILICQSISRLPIDARRHLTHVVAHAQGEPRDIEDLSDRCGRDFAQAVQRLRIGAAPLTWRLGDAAQGEAPQ